MRLTDDERAARERATLSMVRDYITANGFSPSHSEIAERTGQSRAGVVVCLCALDQRGLLQWQRGRRRSIALPMRDKVAV